MKFVAEKEIVNFDTSTNVKKYILSQLYCNDNVFKLKVLSNRT